MLRHGAQLSGADQLAQDKALPTSNTSHRFPTRSKAVATETVWPTKPEIFPSIWPFTESVGPSLAARRCRRPRWTCKAAICHLVQLLSASVSAPMGGAGAAVGPVAVCGCGVKESLVLVATARKAEKEQHRWQLLLLWLWLSPLQSPMETLEAWGRTHGGPARGRRGRPQGQARPRRTQRPQTHSRMCPSGSHGVSWVLTKEPSQEKRALGHQSCAAALPGRGGRRAWMFLCRRKAAPAWRWLHRAFFL